MSKKSQITLFIILGIVFLIAVGSFIYFRASVTKLRVEPEIIVTREIPAELNPVKLYIDSYIKDSTKNAIKLLEMHGGYIDYEPLKTNDIQPTESPAIEFVSGDKIPYWNYLKSKNTCRDDCVFDSEMMPPLCKQGRACITTGKNSIEEQIEEYITSKLDTLDLLPLEQQGFSAKLLKKPEVKATIRENDVVIFAKYPLEIKTPETVHTIDEFQIAIETSLSELYEMAKKITDYDAERCFIGEYVNSVHIPPYYWAGEDTEQKDLPPISEVTYGKFKKKTWVVPDVKNRLKEEISRGVSNIGVLNTKNFKPLNIDCNDDKNKIECGQYYAKLLQPLDKYYDVNVWLSYNPRVHNIYLDIQPSSGNLLIPREFSSPIPFFTALTKTYTYEYSYSYSFPVIVELRKEKAEEERFRFALESNIRAGRCYNAPIPIVQSLSLTGDLTCDDAFRKNRLKLTVLDELTNNPIENAEVTYFAGIGYCPAVFTDSDGIAELKYPDAPYLHFSINKDNYLTKTLVKDETATPITPTSQAIGSSSLGGFAVAEQITGAEQTTTLTPILEKDIEFRLLPIDWIESISKSQGSANFRKDNSEKINEDYSALLEITKKPTSDNEEEFSSTIYFNGSVFLPEKLRIAPGKYDISVQLFLNKQIILPEEHNRICVDDDTVQAIGSGIAGGAASIYGCAAAGFVGFGVGAIACSIVLSTITSKITSPIIGVFSKCEKKPIQQNPPCQFPGPTQEDYEKGTCYKEGYTCEGSCSIKQPIDLPESNLGDKVPLGGLILVDIELTSADLTKDKTIFYIIKNNIPSRLHHLKDMDKYEELSKSARNILLPEFE